MKEIYLKKALKISKEKDLESAVELQKELESYISLDDNFSDPKIISGVDIAYSKEYCYCAIVSVETETLDIIEESFSKSKIGFPYIPGLLFYREFPAFFAAYKKLKKAPDILIFDGQGMSHQRMMGIATMSGIIIEKPTIGCAKSHLYSDGFIMPDNKRFAVNELKVKGILVGFVLRSKENIKPIYISTGYRVSPKSSLEIVKKLITNFKLPLPNHLAHYACESYKKK